MQPQEEATRRQRTAKSIETASSTSFDLVNLVSNVYSSILNKAEFGAEEAVRVLDEFRGTVEDHMLSQLGAALT